MQRPFQKLTLYLRDLMLTLCTPGQWSKLLCGKDLTLLIYLEYLSYFYWTLIFFPPGIARSVFPFPFMSYILKGSLTVLKMIKIIVVLRPQRRKFSVENFYRLNWHYHRYFVWTNCPSHKRMKTENFDRFGLGF